MLYLEKIQELSEGGNEGRLRLSFLYAVISVVDRDGIDRIAEEGGGVCSLDTK